MAFLLHCGTRAFFWNFAVSRVFSYMFQALFPEHDMFLAQPHVGGISETREQQDKPSATWVPSRGALRQLLKRQLL